MLSSEVGSPPRDRDLPSAPQFPASLVKRRYASRHALSLVSALVGASLVVAICVGAANHTHAQNPLFAPPPLVGAVATNSFETPQSETQLSSAEQEQAELFYWQAAGQPGHAYESLVAREYDEASNFPAPENMPGMPAFASDEAPLTALSDPASLGITPGEFDPNSSTASGFEVNGVAAFGAETDVSNEQWTYQILPDGLIYRSYLAADRESRFRSFFFHQDGYGTLWDVTLGGRVGLWRYGTTNAYLPDGWQVDLEGAALPRLDFEHDMNLISVDFRAGLPITYGNGPWRTKFGYYHLSSHLGDEQMLTFPNTPRYNYARDVIILGQAYYLTPAQRIYAEAGWAFYTDVSQEWEFQFGWEYAPSCPTGIHGAPFAAVNGHLRQEIEYSGNFVSQVGWAWRDGPSARLLRVGFEYFNGLSDQYQFWNQFEEKLGLGLWYDY